MDVGRTGFTVSPGKVQDGATFGVGNEVGVT